MTVTRPRASSGFTTVTGTARPSTSLAIATGVPASGEAVTAREGDSFLPGVRIKPSRTTATMRTDRFPILLSQSGMDGGSLEQTLQLFKVDITAAERRNDAGSGFDTDFACEERRRRRGPGRFDEEFG